MDNRFKPVLAAAFAAGLLPAVAEQKAEGAILTAGNFTFEALPTTLGGAGSTATVASTGATSGGLSFSYAADFASPGYTATMLASKSGPANTSTGAGSAGIWQPVAGNNPTPINSLGANNVFGSNYRFEFDIDELTNIVVSFDGRPSNTGPQNFTVEYSLDGVNYGTAGTISMTSANYFSFSFTLPGAFADPNIGVGGDSAFIRLAQFGTDAASGTNPGTGGTFRLDNVLITGEEVPEPATLGLLAASLGLLAGRRRRD